MVSRGPQSIADITRASGPEHRLFNPRAWEGRPPPTAFQLVKHYEQLHSLSFFFFFCFNNKKRKPKLSIIYKLCFAIYIIYKI